MTAEHVTTPKPPVSKRRWRLVAVICLIAAAWYGFHEQLPVWNIDETPLYMVTRDGKQGVVTGDGRVVVPFEWEEIGEFDDHGMAVVVKEWISLPPLTLGIPGTITGVIDRRGRIIIPPELRSGASGFDDHDHYLGTLLNQLVVYNRGGEQLMKAEWEPLADLKFDSFGLLAARHGDDVGWIDRSGVLKVRAPDGLTPTSNFFSNGLAVVHNNLEREGCIDLRGRIVIDTDWTSIHVAERQYDHWNGGFIRDDNYINVVKNNPLEPWHGRRAGCFFRNGATIIPDDYSHIELDVGEAMAHVQGENGMWGVVDFSNRVQIPMEYDSISMFDDRGLAVARKEGLWGWINLQGKVVIPFEYEECSSEFKPFNNYGQAIVSSNGVWGAIETNGRTVVEFEYTGGSHCDDWLGFERDGRWGCFDHQGSVVVPFEYEDPIYFETIGVAIVRKRGVSWVLNRGGEIMPKSTTNRLREISADFGEIDADEDERLYKELTAGRFLEAQYPDDTSPGQGVFSAVDGIVVPLIHSSVTMTRYGFRGQGYVRESLLEKRLPAVSTWIATKFPWLAKSNNELEVLYDFHGHEIWRSDTWLFDRLKASGFALFGFVCLWRSRNK